MCGIAGIYNLNDAPASAESLQKMLALMIHRGPDGEGTYMDGSLALGHRRLAIIDLSLTGHQPMTNEDETVWVVFNGEIYNYLDLRSSLESKGYRFRSRSDTEVILHAYEEYGPACLEHFNGMWGMAIWDKRQRRLFCARDRLGIKPFYYVFNGRQFLFASEIKPLLAVMDGPRKPNELMIYDYLEHSLLEHTDETFFVDVKKLLPGHYLTIDEHGLTVKRYWSLQMDSTVSRLSNGESAARFYELFVDSVRLRLQSEVPVGTCLSGGLDSSSVACVINNLLSDKRVDRTVIGEHQKTFSARFPGHSIDEGKYMSEVVKQINADAHYVYPQGTDLFNDSLKMLWHQEEPIPGTSFYAQWCVMRLARESGITVLLDGEGPDELLGGYSTCWPPYFTELFQNGNWIQLFRELKIAEQEPDGWSRSNILDLIRAKFPERWVTLSRRMRDRPLENSETRSPAALLNKGFIRDNEHKLYFPQRWQETLGSYLYRFITRDHLTHLLRHKDRASMAFSLEGRVPYLDHRLVTFAHSLPSHQKMRNGLSKIVMRRAMKGVIPDLVCNRRDKIGFGTPEKDWFRSEAYDFTRDVFESDSFRQREYFNGNEIRRQFDLYRNNLSDRQFKPWKLVNMELWLRMFIDDNPTNNTRYLPLMKKVEVF